MIEAINLKKSFGHHVLFENLNFQIEHGEFICFSGKSGSGKTTLLNILGHIENYDSGKLLIDGKLLVQRKEKMEFFKTYVGFLFQNFALIESKSVRKNLELVDEKIRNNITIIESLDKVGMSHKLDSKIYTLSGGEQQRVALARLFLKKSQLILADEPTGSLDKENANIIMNLLLDIRSEGKTIILVSHDDNIKKLADRIIHI